MNARRVHGSTASVSGCRGCSSTADLGSSNTGDFNRPKYNREIKRIDRLSGEARPQAWANLDVEMMHDDPPWAPYANHNELDFVSKNFGCYLFDPVNGNPNLAAACKK